MNLPLAAQLNMPLAKQAMPLLSNPEWHKQPWEMTFDEYVKSLVKHGGWSYIQQHVGNFIRLEDLLVPSFIDFLGGDPDTFVMYERLPSNIGGRYLDGIIKLNTLANLKTSVDTLIHEVIHAARDNKDRSMANGVAEPSAYRSEGLLERMWNYYRVTHAFPENNQHNKRLDEYYLPFMGDPDVKLPSIQANNVTIDGKTYILTYKGLRCVHNTTGVEPTREEIQYAYNILRNRVPPTTEIEPPLAKSAAKLSPLEREAIKYDNFDDFKHDYLIEIKHGRYWHITNNPNFQIDTAYCPNNYSTLSSGVADDPGLMVTTDLSRWLAEFPSRAYVAEIDLSNVDPKYFKQTKAGFGNEFWIEPAGVAKAKVVRVFSRQNALNAERRYYKNMPQSELALKQIWESAHAKLNNIPLAKQAARHYETQRFMTINELKQGDLIEITRTDSKLPSPVTPEPFTPLKPPVQEPVTVENLPDLPNPNVPDLPPSISEEPDDWTAIRIMVVSHVVGNVIWGWEGKRIPHATIGLRAAAAKHALGKYLAAIDVNGVIINPAPNSYKYDPNKDTILFFDNAEHLREIQSPIYPTEPWFGRGEKEGYWIPLTASKSPELNRAINIVDKNGVQINYEISFDYIRKLQRHYDRENTTTHKVVRPHFMYTIPYSKDPFVASNQYVLTRDYRSARGEWRSFIIYDSQYSINRMSYIQLGQPFKFDIPATELYVKKGMRHVTDKLTNEVTSVEEYYDKLNAHNLYNALRAYKRYLKGLAKREKKEKEIKQAELKRKFMPRLIKKDAPVFKPRIIKEEVLDNDNLLV